MHNIVDLRSSISQVSTHVRAVHVGNFWHGSITLFKHACLSISSEVYRVLSKTGRKDGNILFNDALNTFYLRTYGRGLFR